MPTPPPDVSVVIPALDAAGTLGDQLEALATQGTAPRFEVVVVDNGSVDATSAVALAFSDRLDLRIVFEGRRGINVARNAGINAARGASVLLCDADDIVSEHWVRELSSVITPHNWAAGPLDFERLNTDRSRALWGCGLRTELAGPTPYRDTGAGGNCGFTAAMWSQLHGFDEGVVGYGDETEFFLRAWQHGFELAWAHDAVVHCRLRGEAGDMLRRRFRQGRLQVELTRRPTTPPGVPRLRTTDAVKSMAVAVGRSVGRVATGKSGWASLGSASLNAGRVFGLAMRPRRRAGQAHTP